MNTERVLLSYNKDEEAVELKEGKMALNDLHGSKYGVVIDKLAKGRITFTYKGKTYKGKVFNKRYISAIKEKK